MTVIDELTPTQYSIGQGKMVVRGKTVGAIKFNLHVTFYNAQNERLDDKYIEIPLSDTEKQAFINAVGSAISELETRTGLTVYNPPEIEP